MSLPAAPNAFGLGAQIFGDAPPLTNANPFKPQGNSKTPAVNTEEEAEEDENSDHESDSGSSSDESLLTALAATTLTESPWKTAPFYPPLYLSTASEYLPPQPKPKLPPGAQVDDPSDDGGKDGKDVSWAFEPYENSLEVDHVFERFTTRVEYEGEQCVR